MTSFLSFTTGSTEDKSGMAEEVLIAFWANFAYLRGLLLDEWKESFILAELNELISGNIFIKRINFPTLVGTKKT